jgi:hypothetical protein
MAELIGRHFEQRVSLGDRNPRFEAPGGLEVVALIVAVGIELERKKNVRLGI